MEGKPKSRAKKTCAAEKLVCTKLKVKCNPKKKQASKGNTLSLSGPTSIMVNQYWLTPIEEFHFLEFSRKVLSSEHIFVILSSNDQTDSKHLWHSEVVQANFLHKLPSRIASICWRLFYDSTQLRFQRCISSDKTLHSHQAVIKCAGHEISSKLGFRDILQFVSDPR